MFDGCAACRKRLARRSEGTLPRSQWGRLESHLSRCPACRRIDEADRALHLMLSNARGAARMSYDAASAFDDRVVRLALNERSPLWRAWLESILDQIRVLIASAPALFLGQVAGGAIAAAAITASCLLATLRPPVPTHYGSIHEPNRDPQAVTAAYNWLNAPPVPLESLLDSPAPRAAMLWTHPRGTQHVARTPGTNSADLNRIPAGTKRPGSSRL